MHQGRAQAVARALGWFSIGLGLAELLAPRSLARAAGLEGRERRLQLYGACKIASGVALLFARNPKAMSLKRKESERVFDYSARSGFKRPASALRGAAIGKVKERRAERPPSPSAQSLDALTRV